MKPFYSAYTVSYPECKLYNQCANLYCNNTSYETHTYIDTIIHGNIFHKCLWFGVLYEYTVLWDVLGFSQISTFTKTQNSPHVEVLQQGEAITTEPNEFFKHLCLETMWTCSNPTERPEHLSRNALMLARDGQIVPEGR